MYYVQALTATLILSEYHRGVPEEVGAGLSFISSATQGALLILPEGGKRIEHSQWTTLYSYTAECAQSWYDYVNGPRDQGGLARGIYRGLYLVTGCDKARAWGVASFEDAKPPERSACLEFVPKSAAVDTYGTAPQYRFSRCDFAASFSDAEPAFGQLSGCVFLRGFRVAIQNRPKNPFIPFSPFKVTHTSNMTTHLGAFSMDGMNGPSMVLQCPESNTESCQANDFQPSFPFQHEVGWFQPLLT